ncbi:ISOC2 [Cordylochernes scorpioides]|uniref:ISOC2 n=1 Tax=Cordylochernes scorpioides TaxID=51811 RepID=A0ABY6KLM9_9ARAC|nr:ISOC2 [Cordylochernes scorpioides]
MSVSKRLGMLSTKNSCLFLCDMQEKFRSYIKYFNEIVSVSSRLLRAAKILDMQVIITEQYPKGLGNTVPELGIGEYPDLVPHIKTQFSMMVPEVVDLLKMKPEINSVILCGIESHVCIQGTCLSLLRSGYDVHIVTDACSSRTMVDR